MSNKQKVNPEDALGKYLVEDVNIQSEVKNMETGEFEPCQITILRQGAYINELTYETLKSNGITEVTVSDVKLTGKNEPKIKVWKCVVEYFDNVSFKIKKYKYFVIEKSPADAENLLTEILETKIHGAFRLISVVPFEKCEHAIFRINDEDKFSKSYILSWYNVIHNVINIDGDAGYERSMLIQTNNIMRIRKIVQNWFEEYNGKGEREILRIADTKAVDVIQPDGMDIFRYYDL